MGCEKLSEPAHLSCLGMTLESLQPILRADSMWGEARNTKVLQEKEGSSKGKKGGRLLLQTQGGGRGNIIRLRHKGHGKHTSFPERGEAWKKKDSHGDAVH